MTRKETLRAQLEQEREQLDLLRQEVRRLSDERDQEAIDARIRQQQQDQEVAKLRSKQPTQQHESSENNSQDNNTPQRQHLQTLSDQTQRASFRNRSPPIAITNCTQSGHRYRSGRLYQIIATMEITTVAAAWTTS